MVVSAARNAMPTLLIIEDNFELASLLQAAAEARGHSAKKVHTAKEALDAIGVRRPDLAICDLMLPDMAGGDLLAKLKRSGVPAIAMSGVYRGSNFAREAIEQHGAIAFFEKPFPLQELLVKVEAICGPAKVLLSTDSTEELTREVVVVEPPSKEPGNLLPLEQWERIWRKGATAPAQPTTPKKSLPRSGSLKDTSVPRLLNAFFQVRHSGELVLHRPPAIKVVSFEQGQPVYAASNLAHERFARCVARNGLLAPADLDAVAALAREQGLRTGVAMVRLGVITEQQRVKMLEGQIREIIWSTFSWVDGEYTFTRGKPLRADLVRLEVFPGDLILEGCLKEPLVALRARLPSTRLLTPAADPPYPLERFRFSYEQASLIAATDGTKSVADLVALSDLSEREVLGLIVGLEQLGLVEERKETPRSRRVSFGL
jgi:CheY-like chemotaxis protein